MYNLDGISRLGSCYLMTEAVCCAAGQLQLCCSLSASLEQKSLGESSLRVIKTGLGWSEVKWLDMIPDCLLFSSVEMLLLLTLPRTRHWKEFTLLLESFSFISPYWATWKGNCSPDHFSACVWISQRSISLHVQGFRPHDSLHIHSTLPIPLANTGKGVSQQGNVKHHWCFLLRLT